MVTGLKKKIDALINCDALKTCSSGILIESLSDGRVLYEHQSHRTFMPASVMKLLVSAAMLETFGPDYRLRTEVLGSGEPNADGILRGDLVLKGYGNPVMSIEDLGDITLALKSLGIRRVCGNLVVDDSYFDNVRMGWGWSWDYQSDSYAAQISALTLNRNVVRVIVQPGKSVGELAPVALEPITGYMRIDNSAVTSAKGSKSEISVHRLRAQNVVSVSGAIPLGSEAVKTLVTVEEPALFAGSIFLQLLEKEGIHIDGELVHAPAAENMRILHSHYSEPLSRILALLNKPSDNLIAECLFKMLGAEVKGKGSRTAAAEAEADFLKSIGANPDEANIADGSGLSRLNIMSAANIVAILKAMHKSRHSKVFIESLPVAGVDGSLQNRLKETPAEQNVKAKPGYLGWVTTLAGYVNTRSGEPLAFCFLMNNFLCTPEEVRQVYDQILLLLVNLP